ncbi:MAG: uracil-DNA glycosylase [Gammaproteobacteria bacterium]|nr:uracil-DNA glycosylase [Gammaproteobacteria bacterium]
MDTTIENKTITWQTELAAEKEQPYFQKLMAFVKSERSNKEIYPPQSDVFNALKFTPLETVKVVVIGQDPYHGPKQAHGLSFSVLPGIKPPPSLKNIFLELNQDLNIPISNNGCLIKWAEQGVLLLNAVLTVEAGKPQSHAKMGWEQFTDKIIQVLNDKREGLVFLLWGAYAQRKGEIINPTKHHILTAAHPSPFSVRGFLSCKHFSKTNAILTKLGKTPIDWKLEN